MLREEQMEMEEPETTGRPAIGGQQWHGSEALAAVEAMRKKFAIIIAERRKSPAWRSRVERKKRVPKEMAAEGNGDEEDWADGGEEEDEESSTPVREAEGEGVKTKTHQRKDKRVLSLPEKTQSELPQHNQRTASTWGMDGLLDAEISVGEEGPSSETATEEEKSNSEETIGAKESSHKHRRRHMQRKSMEPQNPSKYPADQEKSEEAMFAEPKPRSEKKESHRRRRHSHRKSMGLLESEETLPREDQTQPEDTVLIEEPLNSKQTLHAEETEHEGHSHGPKF
jgi:hypothetical protein